MENLDQFNLVRFERAKPFSVFSEVLESHYNWERSLRTQRTLKGLAH